LEKGAQEKPKEEDEALKQKAVTYVQYDDLIDFETENEFTSNQSSFIDTTLPAMI